ncbi:MAG: beta-ketoacyl-ACP synthase III [Gammaproteobacteria bacterium]|nr:beta-ketoacyl-ACP synthase III [Gammaproteobacteria bacterium]
MNTTRYARIIGTGSYLPPNIVTNDDLAKRMETTHEWIVERTGIEKRHIAGPDETSGSMAKIAAERAIESAGISPKDIDLILVATVTPDFIIPSVSCLLQDHFNLGGCPAMDIGAACSGFIYGLSIADQYIKTGAAKTILLVASEAMSRIIDWNDRRTCILFGDGAGAVIIQASDKPGICSTHLHADGGYKDLLWAPSAFPSQKKEGLDPFVIMKGNEVFKLAVNHLSKSVDEVLEANHLKSSDLDWLVPHQANMRIIQAIAKKLNLPMEKVILTIADHSNTSAASIPLAMDAAIRDGRIKRGDKLLLEAFGAGLTWGSALVVY